MDSVLLAKREPGGAAGHVWEKGGDAGAQEVHISIAAQLLRIPGDLFYVVDKAAKAAVKKAEVQAEAVVEEAAEAVEEKVAPKKRAAAAKE